MKFKVDSKEHGNRVKKEILFLEKEMAHITVACVKDILSEPIKDIDRDYSWEIKGLRLQRKLRVRETSTGWYLYFPEPEYIPYGDGSDPVSFRKIENEEPEDIDWIRYIVDQFFILRDTRRPVEVIHKKDRKIEKRYGMFHDWTTNRVVKEDGTIVDQLLAIVEFPDGHVERIDHKNILFSWYEEV